MLRQYSSRNQRNRGIKVKHALQICFIVAVCFWLIYQLKHSHDKKEDFEENDAEGSLDRGSSGGLIKIRRKDIRPLYEEIVTENKQHDEATEEENEALRDGDDERDEHEVEKFDTEVDKEEDNITVEEREDDGIDRETEGEISDDGNGRKQENSVEDGGHDRGDKSNHSAREEFYEADDASSTVTHDNHTQTTEKEREVVGISDQHQERNLDRENKDNHSEEAKNGKTKKRLEVDGGETSDDANPLSATDIATNVTTSKTKENHSDSSKKGSSQNNTLTEAPNNSTTDVTAHSPKSSKQNVTGSVAELDHDEGIVTEGTSTKGSNLKTIGLQQANSFTSAVENHHSDSNSTGHTELKNTESDFEDFTKPSNDSLLHRPIHITQNQQIRAFSGRWNQHTKE